MQVLVQVQRGSDSERQSVAYATGSLDRLGYWTRFNFQVLAVPGPNRTLDDVLGSGEDYTLTFQEQLVFEMLSNYPHWDSNPLQGSL